MINNKFFLGITVGLISTKIYPIMKRKGRPAAVKVARTTLYLGENVKEFINDAVCEAKDRRQKKYESMIEKNSTIHIDDIQSIEAEKQQLYSSMVELKKQIDILSGKIEMEA